MADKNVQLPDGRVVAFPDTMSDDDISGVIRTQLSGTPPPTENEIRPAATGAGPWLQNLESDVRQGTQITGVGKFLHFLGARGTDAGVSPGAADQVASPVLGPIQAAQGVVEGKPLKAAGGVLQAATYPMAFSGPPASKAIEAAPEALQAARGAASEGAEGVSNWLARMLRNPATARQSQMGKPGTVKNFLPDILRRYTVPDVVIPKGSPGTPTNPGVFSEIPTKLTKAAQALQDVAPAAEEGAETAAQTAQRPLRPTVGTPEEWATYEQQMKQLKQEASDAGTYSAARGKVAKKLNYQQRIKKSF